MRRKHLKRELKAVKAQLEMCRQHNRELRSELNTRKMLVSEMDDKEKAWQEKAVEQQQRTIPVEMVLPEQPTRPSEDDMITKPQQQPCPAVPTYDQHPQFRDIGVRIDRYGKLVFKPELVE